MVSPFRLTDESTHGQPQASTQLDHPEYGVVTIDIRTELQVSRASYASLRVTRVRVEDLPNKKLPPSTAVGWPVSAGSRQLIWA